MDLTSKLVIAAISIGALYGLVVWQRHWVAELHAFLGEVRMELKKVAWPGGKEVRSTTMVVIVTVIIFGVFLSTVDFIFAWLRTELFKAVGL